MKYSRHIPETDAFSASPAFQIHIARAPQAIEEFDDLLNEHHYLGADCQGGDYFRQVVYENGSPIALLAWGSACYALKDRDLHIGWNPPRRAELQKLVVQNRRYCLLTAKGERPNLASQVLGAALRELPKQWMKHFGYEPLGAETFSDIEAFEGTCYKATGWLPLGKTKGFSRHRADFFTPNGRPKKLWFKPLRKDAEKLLREGELPPECQAGAHSDAHGVLPVTLKQLDSLFELFYSLEDTRARNRTYRLPSVLCVVSMAMMIGLTDISSIARFAKRMRQSQRKRICLPRKKGTNFRMAPSYDVIYRVLKQVNPEELAQRVGEWMNAHQGSLPGTLALDGKMIKDIAGVVSLVDTETGVARSMAPMRHKEEGERGETTIARKVIRQAGDLSNQTLSGDALHANRETAEQILGQGGDYLLQIKDNQPELLKEAKKRLKASPLFLRKE
jgi:hypothetical protein